jgi:hypothetical protein
MHNAKTPVSWFAGKQDLSSTIDWDGEEVISQSDGPKQWRPT